MKLPEFKATGTFNLIVGSVVPNVVAICATDMKKWLINYPADAFFLMLNQSGLDIDEIDVV
jgi:hypothetical protein